MSHAPSTAAPPAELLHEHAQDGPTNSVESKISLINDPRNEYNKLYTVDKIGYIGILMCLSKSLPFILQ